MDGLRAHQIEGIKEMVEAVGAKVTDIIPKPSPF
jgi:hypothetical protein